LTEDLLLPLHTFVEVKYLDVNGMRMVNYLIRKTHLLILLIARII
jgi:hypothetical protein